MIPSPPPDDPGVQTLARLRVWMAEHGYHHRTISVGQLPEEGHALRAGPYGFEWLWTERGRTEILRVFSSEAEATRHALDQLRADASAREHLVCFTDEISARDRVLSTLSQRAIAHRHDTIPFGGPSRPFYRIFVWGRDFERCADLSSRHIHRQAR